MEFPQITSTPKVEVTIDEVRPSDWDELVTKFADANLFQSSAYGRVRYGCSNLSNVTVSLDGVVQSIAQVRTAKLPLLNRGLAYVRWGPLFEREGEEANPLALSTMAEVLYSEYVQKRRLWLQVAPMAYAGSRREILLDSAFKEFRKGFEGNAASQTFLLDITDSDQEIRKRLDQKWRNQLNRAERNQLSILESSDNEGLQSFFSMYDQMIARKSFQETHNVRDFDRIQSMLSAGRKLWVFLCISGSRPVSGVVVSKMGRTGIYLLGATSDEGLKLKGSYLLQWHAILRLKSCGVKSYDLSGANASRNPGVFHFKEGLGGDLVSYVAPYHACVDRISTLIKGLTSVSGPKVRVMINRMLHRRAIREVKRLG